MSFLVMKIDQCVYLLLKAMTKFFDVMESKPILKGTRLQSICRFVENHFCSFCTPRQGIYDVNLDAL